VYVINIFQSYSLLSFLPADACLKYKMKLAIIASLLTSAAAFAPQPQVERSTALNMAKYASKLQYVPCISVEDLPDPGGATSGVAGGLAICIAVDTKGTVFALGDKCPPVGQPLSFGNVNSDGTISDPVLGTKFSLKTGAVVGKWCPSGIGGLIGGVFSPSGVPVYPVKKNGKTIDVQVDVNAKLNFEANYWSGILDAQGKSNGKYY
jgi:nitrite reductase/ring-hydroxylating ferredoxin subunit